MGYFWKNALLLCASLALALLLGELLLRVAGVGYPAFYIADRHRGIAHRPHAEGWYRREGRAYIRINSDGLRDREHTRARAPGTLRIAVLGDSYAEALQLPMEQAFWAILEARLGECQARAVEVINFGVSGYGTAQQLQTLRYQVRDYAPDLVLLAFFSGNDIRNNHPALNREPGVPYFVYQDGELVLDDSYLAHPSFGWPNTPTGRVFYWFLYRSRLLQLLNHLRLRLAAGNTGDTHVRVPGQEPGLDDNIYLVPAEPVWREAWRVTEDLLRLTAAEVGDIGAAFVLVSLSNSIQVHPDPALRRDFAARLGVDDLFYPDRRLQALARREGWFTIALAEPFQAHAEAREVCLHGFANAMPCAGHWNAAGHRLAGEIIARRLCQAPGLFQ